MEDINIDPQNIVGMSSLMADDIDVGELEQEIVNGFEMSIEKENILHDFEKQINSLGDEFKMLYNDEQSPISYTPVDNTTSIYDTVPVYKTTSHSLPTFKDPELTYKTQEQEKQEHVKIVCASMEDSKDFDLEETYENENKIEMLEQINSLRSTLEDDGVDVSKVREVDTNSSIAEINRVYNVLRIRNDTNRYRTFAEEVILSLAYGVECLFDGKNDWFGRKPDLTGWSKSVAVKMRRLRFETSNFVRDVMQTYNFSAGMRVAFELLPSMFLYSRKRASSIKNRDTIIDTDNQYADAISDMNSMS